MTKRNDEKGQSLFVIPYIDGRMGEEIAPVRAPARPRAPRALVAGRAPRAPRMWRERGDARPPLREGREVRILIPRAATPRTAKEQLRAAARGTLRTGYCDRKNTDGTEARREPQAPSGAAATGDSMR